MKGKSSDLDSSDLKSIVLTIHGAGYGLDEIEAFESQLAGIVESVSCNDYPPTLEEITFVEFNENRCARLLIY